MFRIYDRENNRQVFTQNNPRTDGYEVEVEEDVTLDYPPFVHVHPDGEARPEAVLGRLSPKAYRVFRNTHDLRQANAQPLPGTVIVCISWADYLRGHPAACGS